MSSDGHESGAIWQGPGNANADQYRTRNQSSGEDELPPLPVPRSGEQQSSPQLEQVEQDDPTTEEQPSIADKGRELVHRSSKYIFILAVPLLFAALTAMFVLPLVATSHAMLPPLGFWPVTVVILVVAIAQGVFAYYADADTGILAIGTLGSLFLFLLIATFSIFGLFAGVTLLLLLLVASVVLSRFYVHPVPEGRVDIVYSFGKYSRTLYSGFNVVLPWEKVTNRLKVGETQWVCPAQRVQMSRDEDVSVSALVSYQLTPEDAYLAVLQGKNWEESLREFFITLLHTSIRHFTPDDLIPWPRSVRSRTTFNGGSGGSADTIMRWERVNDELFQQLRDRVALWGVQVNTVRLRDVVLVPHDTPLVDTDKVVDAPSINRAATFDNDETTQPSFNNPKAQETTKKIETPQPTQQTPKAAQADSAAAPTQATPAVPLNEEALTKAYKAVQEGKITDPETIRSIAASFDAVAKDPKLSQTVSFDAARAARNLYTEAQKHAEQYSNGTLYNDQTKIDRPARRVTDENLMAGG